MLSFASLIRAAAVALSILFAVITRLTVATIKA